MNAAREKVSKNIAARAKIIGPIGVSLLFIGFLWLWSAIATYHDLVGKPSGAPHLRISGHYRAMIWVVTGLYAIYASHHLRKHANRALTLLAVMPAIRVSSYFVSWFFSLHPIDTITPDRYIKGDPGAWGSMWIYIFILFTISLLAWGNEKEGRRIESGEDVA